MERTVALIDERAPRELIRALELRGFVPITLSAHPALGEAVRSHTDMLVVKENKNIISLSSYCEAAPALFDDLYTLLSRRGYSFVFLDEEVGSEYPGDAALNVLAMGRRVFCRRASAAEGLIRRYEDSGAQIINVKQGYPACTVLSLGSDAAITADRGMARALQREGIDVTLIDEGHILLPPHKYGFIGGCAGIHDGVVYFTGRVENHPSYGKIREATERMGLCAVSLTDLPLIDLGGILFID